jgi:hypothetical protein
VSLSDIGSLRAAQPLRPRLKLAPSRESCFRPTSIHFPHAHDFHRFCFPRTNRLRHVDFRCHPLAPSSSRPTSRQNPSRESRRVILQGEGCSTAGNISKLRRTKLIPGHHSWMSEIQNTPKLKSLARGVLYLASQVVSRFARELRLGFDIVGSIRRLGKRHLNEANGTEA